MFTESGRKSVLTLCQTKENKQVNLRRAHRSTAHLYPFLQGFHSYCQRWCIHFMRWSCSLDLQQQRIKQAGDDPDVSRRNIKYSGVQPDQHITKMDILRVLVLVFLWALRYYVLPLSCFCPAPTFSLAHSIAPSPLHSLGRSLSCSPACFVPSFSALLLSAVLSVEITTHTRK